MERLRLRSTVRYQEARCMLFSAGEILYKLIDGQYGHKLRQHAITEYTGICRVLCTKWFLMTIWCHVIEVRSNDGRNALKR